jgi:hypothetical protein
MAVKAESLKKQPIIKLNFSKIKRTVSLSKTQEVVSFEPLRILRPIHIPALRKLMPSPSPLPETVPGLIEDRAAPPGDAGKDFGSRSVQAD